MSRTTNFFTTASIAALTALAVCGGYHASGTANANVAQPRKPIGMRVLAKVTAYCPCAKCCGKFSDGVTSRGRDAFKTRGVAVDPKRIAYGSKVTIPGAGTFIADDTGGAMRNADGYHIDLRFHTHQAALNWGVKHLEVTIVK